MIWIPVHGDAQLVEQLDRVAVQLLVGGLVAAVSGLLRLIEWHALFLCL
jgi:hypothetical protein